MWDGLSVRGVMDRFRLMLCTSLSEDASEELGIEICCPDTANPSSHIDSYLGVKSEVLDLDSPISTALGLMGDSGGPMYANIEGLDYIIGIASIGVGCARPYHPGIFTRVSYYLDWIKKHVYLNS
ncbi:unnamed protein product [Cyprideis torosa]|uniref:Uncharacterized protein n=1 Tax=Cyprideis torosa TaxID=163714 RepID=A0A7R8W648_9CRUS|nr:unnamed protein product [Cyprideis torosa]CAG0886121.1 unnamed protein product [Cyprideis torosa]